MDFWITMAKGERQYLVMPTKVTVPCHTSPEWNLTRCMLRCRQGPFPSYTRGSGGVITLMFGGT